MPGPTTRVMQASSWWDCPHGRVLETRNGVALPQLVSVSERAAEPTGDSLFLGLWLGGTGMVSWHSGVTFSLKLPLHLQRVHCSACFSTVGACIHRGHIALGYGRVLDYSF